MAFNIKNAVAKAVSKTADMNVAVKGGGTYTPPATGTPGLRFVAYIELGPQNDSYQGKPRVREKVKLIFELHGKKWPMSESGQPQRLTLTLAKSLNEKATFYKLFRAMNYSGKHKHFAEMLGEDFIGTVFHRADKNDKSKVYAEFKDPNTSALTIRAPFVEDDDGEAKRRNVPDAVSELRLFLWDSPDAEQWASIYIDGEYDDGNSKNVFQNAIKESPEFEGSPIEALLAGGDLDTDDDDIEAAKDAAKKKKAAKAAPVDDDPDDTSPSKPAAKKAAPAKKAKPAKSDDPLGDLGDE